jgi:hypothetical protein
MNYATPMYPGATPLPKLLREVAAELRTRAKNIRKGEDFHALVLSAACDKTAHYMEQLDTPTED